MCIESQNSQQKRLALRGKHLIKKSLRFSIMSSHKVASPIRTDNEFAVGEEFSFQDDYTRV